LDDSTHRGLLKKLLTLAAIGETATGLALLIVPSLVVRLLFDAEIVRVGVVMSRLAGIALIGLGVACWPGTDTRQASCGMVTYSVLAMLYLTYIGVRGEWVGLLLWPAVVVHAVLTLLLARAWFKPQEDRAA
jgi:Na+-driven multidrug efflux pump